MFNDSFKVLLARIYDFNQIMNSFQLIRLKLIGNPILLVLQNENQMDMNLILGDDLFVYLVEICHDL